MKTGLSNIRNRVFYLLLFLIILIPVTFVSGCNGGGGEDGEAEPSPAPTSRKIFIANFRGRSVSVFDADAEGNIAPIRRIGSRTGLFTPIGMFVDTVNDEIFVTNNGNNTITVYGRTDSGDVAPLRTIGGPNTFIFSPEEVFVDTVNDEIFVANLPFSSNVNGMNYITVYGRTDEGNVFPRRVITGLSLPVGIFVDTENDELFVIDQLLFFSSFPDFEFPPFLPVVKVFRRTDDSLVSPVFPVRTIITSEITDEGGILIPTAIHVDTANDEIFVAMKAFIMLQSDVPLAPLNDEGKIRVYRRTDNGDASPLRAIEGSDTGLLNTLGIFVDAESDELFALNSFDNSVTVYERTSSGNVSPIRTLLINRGLGFETRDLSSSIFVDTENDELFIAGKNDKITVYVRTAEGNASPLRTIGSNTGLLGPQWIHVDTENNEIFTSNFLQAGTTTIRQITAHEITDKGNVPPSRTISQGKVSLDGIFVDTENDEIFVANINENAISVYSRTGGVNTAPIRTIKGPSTGLNGPLGIFVDTDNDEVFVTNNGNNTITVYRTTGSGNIPPLRVIRGPDAVLFDPEGIFVDAENDEIFVANTSINTITVYRRTGSGDNIIPLRTLRGPNTGLSAPEGIFVDNNEIFVANNGNNTITVYRSTDEGDVTPLRTIAGANTGLSGPLGIFVAESP